MITSSTTDGMSTVRKTALLSLFVVGGGGGASVTAAAVLHAAAGDDRGLGDRKRRLWSIQTGRANVKPTASLLYIFLTRRGRSECSD